MKKKWKLPVDKNSGTPFTFVDGYEEKHFDIDWVEPYQFEDTLELVDYIKGRSAVNMIFESKTDGRRYSAGLGGFFDMCATCQVNNTEKSFTITGKFTFAKRGQNYLMVPAE